MKVVNRRARYDYELLEKFEAGLVLTGAEVKSVKAGRINLEESFIRVSQGEAWFHNAHIPAYPMADNQNYEPTRTRKLLLHKKEILKLLLGTQTKKLTIVPISCYTKGRNIKLSIALAKGKRKYEKRKKIKERDFKREQERLLRDKETGIRV
ncbi:SsrA-binding protein SmpB [Patescibacteria group bacterium]